MPLRLADESDDELVNVHFRSGKWKDHKDAQRVTIRLCNVYTGRVLELINPRRACAARVTVVVLCVCLVCLSPTILALQATRRLMSDTNRFSATRAGKITWRFC